MEQLEHLKHLELPRSVFCLALNGCDLQRLERREAVERLEHWNTSRSLNDPGLLSLGWMQHVDQSAGGNQLLSGGFPGRPISRVLFPIGKRRFVAPVRQLLHGFFMRRSRHKRSDRLIVPPDRQRPERKPARFSHSDTEIARGPFRLPDRSPGVPEEPRKKAQRAQAKSGDGDDRHSWSSKESAGFGRIKTQALNLLFQQTQHVMRGHSFYDFII